LDWVFFHAGQFELDSSNGYDVAFQADGNLVIYDLGHAIWASGTQGTSYTKLLWFTPGGPMRIGDASSPRTYKFFGGNTSTAYPLLIMQTDGNLVEYSTADCRTGTSPVWAWGTVGKKEPGRAPPRQVDRAKASKAVAV
jgi:hypothetical protein